MRVLLTGGTGMLGKALIRDMESAGVSYFAPTRRDLNLAEFKNTFEVIGDFQPSHIIHAAARVGGISENITKPLSFLTENLEIDLNILEASRQHAIHNLLYMSSSCIYPANAQGLLTEDLVLAGKPEETNLNYAIAKISGMQYVSTIANQTQRNWRSLILSNLYGPNDHFNSSKSHLLAAIISKVHLAIENGENEVEMWGAGTARREFTYVEDVSKFIISHLQNVGDFPYKMNLGVGIDYSVRDYYQFVIDTFGVPLKIVANLSKPTGIGQKLMSSNIAGQLGWGNLTDINDGLKKTITWYKTYSGNEARN